MAPLNWATYLERAVGKGHPTLSDTVNRALRQMLSESGYDPDATTFPGLMGPVFNVKSFDASGDGVTDDTLAVQAALTAAGVSGGAVIFPTGRYKITQTLTVATPGKVALIGVGIMAAELINGITGTGANPLLSLSVEGAHYLIQGLYFSGNSLTGSSGNGHAIVAIDPSGGFLAPQEVMIRDCLFTGMRGTGKDYLGASIPACAIYGYNGVALVIDNCTFTNLAMGVRLNAYEKVYHSHSVFDICDNNCLYLEADCEDIGITNCVLNGSGSGGAKDGLIYITGGTGGGCNAVAILGCRLKNGNPYILNVSTDIGGDAIYGLLMAGCSVPQLDVASGHTALAFSNGCRGVVIQNNVFEFVNTMTDAVGILVSQVASGYDMMGLTIAGNTFQIGTGGTIANGVKLNVTSNRVVAPTIQGNTFGKYDSGGMTITSAIELAGRVDAPVIQGNSFVAVAGDTITNAIKLTNGTVTGTIILNNLYRAFGGTISNEIAQSGNVPYLRIESGLIKFVASGTAVGHIEMDELSTDPAAPATNVSRLYTRDNGAGKTQLVARFPTGAVQVIATEP